MTRLIASALLLCVSVFAELPLTQEQFDTRQTLERLRDSGELGFEYDLNQVKPRHTGYKKPPAGFKSAISDRTWQMVQAGPFKQVDLRNVGFKVPDIMDQGNCGSCVVFSVMGNIQWSHAFRFPGLPILSPQHLMNCGGPAGQCQGDWGERVAKRAKVLGTFATEKDYPYTQRNGNCKDTSKMTKHGQVTDWETIPDNFQALIAALNNHQPISVGVAADNLFASYKSGLYTGFGSMGTNHYVLIVGASCGSSVDADGNCLFDNNGNLQNGNEEGEVLVANSWDVNWGDNGYIRMQYENKNGRRNNNIAGGEGNAQIIETGLPVIPLEPVTFDLKGKYLALTVTVQPKSLSSVAVVKQRLIKRINQLEKGK